MSNYNSTATATIYVNGQPAQQTIAKLKDDVLGYKKRLQEIAADKSLGVNSKEWNDVRKKMVEAEKELGRVQSGVANVAQVMLRLDKATPNSRKKTFSCHCVRLAVPLRFHLENRLRLNKTQINLVLCPPCSTFVA